MRTIWIVFTTLVIGWLPVTASALLLKYDLELKGCLYNPYDNPHCAQTKTFYGEALVNWNEPTYETSWAIDFSIQQFTLEVDGTSLVGNGGMHFAHGTEWVNLYSDLGSLRFNRDDAFYFTKYTDFPPSTNPLPTLPILSSFVFYGPYESSLPIWFVDLVETPQDFSYPVSKIYDSSLSLDLRGVYVPEPPMLLLLAPSLIVVLLSRRKMRS